MQVGSIKNPMGWSPAEVVSSRNCLSSEARFTLAQIHCSSTLGNSCDAKAEATRWTPTTLRPQHFAINALLSSSRVRGDLRRDMISFFNCDLKNTATTSRKLTVISEQLIHNSPFFQSVSARGVPAAAALAEWSKALHLRCILGNTRHGFESHMQQKYLFHTTLLFAK